MTSHSQPRQIWIIEPKQARVGYYLIYALGILQVFACAALVYYATSVQEYILAGLLANLALLFLSVAQLLGMEKGGLAFQPDSGTWLLFGRDSSDVISLPAADVVGLAVERRTEYWGRSPDPVLVSSIHLVLRDGVRVGILQMSSLQDAQERAEWIREATGVAPIQEGGVVCEVVPCRVPFAPGLRIPADPQAVKISTRTGVSGPLAWTLILAALFCILSGGLLLAGLSVTGLVGALFGPVLLFLGLGFSSFLVFRAYGWQDIALRPGAPAQSCFRLGSIRWSKQELTLNLTTSMVRLVTRGIHGFHLELIEGDRMIIIGAGSTVHSPLPPATLFALARYIEALRHFDPSQGKGVPSHGNLGPVQGKQVL